MNNIELEKIKIRVDIIYKKLLLFIAMAGGSWVYGTKFADSLFSLLLFGFFIFISFGIIINILKLNDIEKQLRKENNHE